MSSGIIIKQTVTPPGGPWYRVGHTEGGTPWASLALDWCKWCQQEVDTDTEARHKGDLYLYKRWCRRCGHVVKYGAVRAPLVGGARQGVPALAVNWMTHPEKDRR